MSAALGDQPALARWMRRLYELSSIEGRYSVLDEEALFGPDSRFSPGLPRERSATTGERMAIYCREAGSLATEAARCALAELADGAAASITHLIAVSCTGFVAPGIDQQIAYALGLAPTVERTVVGFMGCAASFNALRLADQIVSARPTARVLVVCVELCTLHLQPGSDRTSLITAALFADGAAACVVGAPAAQQGDAFHINGFRSAVVPGTAGEMRWDVGDHGFVIVLSGDVPRMVAAAAPPMLEEMARDYGQPSFWAIHPGGRAIVDRLAERLNLAPDDIAPSLAVLHHYGNMSSPTSLFVLQAHRERLRLAYTPRDGVAVAFGPGLTVELAHLTYSPCAASNE